MKRLRFDRLRSCAFSDSISRAETYLRRHSGTLHVPIRLGSLNMRLRRAVTARITVSRDVSDMVRIHDALHLELHPLRGLPFPHMHVHVMVRPQIPPGTRLMLELSYMPPLRPVGHLFDSLVGKHMVAAIANTLLDELCAELSVRKPGSEPPMRFGTLAPTRESSSTATLR